MIGTTLFEKSSSCGSDSGRTGTVRPEDRGCDTTALGPAAEVRMTPARSASVVSWARRTIASAVGAVRRRAPDRREENRIWLSARRAQDAPCLVRSALVNALVVLLAAAPLGALAESRDAAFAKAQLAVARDLLARAADIVAATPATSMQAALMVRGHEGPAGIFYDRERAFQSAVRDHRVRPDGASGAGAAIAHLQDSDPFLYAAVQSAVAACNRHDATANLRVARAIISEADRAMAGRGNENFEPPQITETGQVTCR